jgi:hypothetical protein
MRMEAQITAEKKQKSSRKSVRKIPQLHRTQLGVSIQNLWTEC